MSGWSRRITSAAETVVGERRRHAHIDQSEFGLQRPCGVHQRAGITHRTDDLVTALLQKAHEPGTQQDAVFGDQDSHGNSTRIEVGPP